MHLRRSSYFTCQIAKEFLFFSHFFAEWVEDGVWGLGWGGYRYKVVDTRSLGSVSLRL